MTTIFNKPEDFRDEMVEGLLAAYGRYLEPVPGASGVMRRGGVLAGKVSVIIGGGSGHYPTFAGFVGQGLADGAVIGDIFTSPSTEHVYRAVRALDGGAGVLLSYGRYSGDIMNFGMAEKRAREEGIDVRTVLVTDDVASAPPERFEERRGIAGDFCVFKIAGAAAERGDDMDEVERLARKANARARTLGVAFGGCTLPGSREPLFVVEPGRIEIGMGIHGEPGVRSGERVGAAELARVLVEPLLASEERPEGADERAVVLLDGLGRTKYEELFVLYRDVARLLHDAGLRAVAPEVGELVTSLDMAGCSLTLFWLDEELEELWAAPADAPGYRKGSVAPVRGGAALRPLPLRSRSSQAAASSREEAVTPSSGLVDAEAAAVARLAFDYMLRAIEPAEEELGRIDAVAGDGDHGRGMLRGLRAAAAAASGAGDVPGEVVIAAGRAWAEAAGGASGALWGGMLQAFGQALVEQGTGPAAVTKALTGAVGALAAVGGAGRGDKTMLDALGPFVDAFIEHVQAGDELAVAWAAAVPASDAGARHTASLISKRGRSAVLGERSRGTPDPGAVSMSYCLAAVSQVLAEAKTRG
ncbi:MAG: dihydroxyacetone kinase family protein [Acidimicrobiales bacterium]